MGDIIKDTVGEFEGKTLEYSDLSPDMQERMKEFNKPGGKGDRIVDGVKRMLEDQRQEDLKTYKGLEK